MSLHYIGFIVLSALLHASYNFLMRKSGGDEGFLLTMFMVTAGIAVGLGVLAGAYDHVSPRHLIYLFMASFFYVLYQVLVSKAYEKGNISALYPLTVLSPIFIPVWAFFFLSESISLVTGMGIVMTVAGAITAQLQSFSLTEVKKILRFHRDYLGARYALGASFVYSFGAIFDKAALATFSVVTYLSIMVSFMTVTMLLYWSFYKKQEVVSVVSKHWKPGLIGGIMLYLSFLLFRVALKEVFVSLAIPVRQVAIVFAIVLGVLFLKEEVRPRTVIGSFVIIGGVLLVNIGI